VFAVDLRDDIHETAQIVHEPKAVEIKEFETIALALLNLKHQPVAE
jgi:hypothetical protein